MNKITEVYFIIIEKEGLTIEPIYIKLENKGPVKASENKKKIWNVEYFMIPGSYVYQINLVSLSD